MWAIGSDRRRRTWIKRHQLRQSAVCLVGRPRGLGLARPRIRLRGPQPRHLGLWSQEVLRVSSLPAKVHYSQRPRVWLDDAGYELKPQRRKKAYSIQLATIGIYAENMLENRCPLRRRAGHVHEIRPLFLRVEIRIDAICRRHDTLAHLPVRRLGVPPHYAPGRNRHWPSGVIIAWPRAPGKGSQGQSLISGRKTFSAPAGSTSRQGSSAETINPVRYSDCTD